ncbi:MAG TPA: FHIPEP family type III secretion protein [Candidatus Eremiobacteraeota bacterium]|nr:MAG: Flagellar biosynthesis protein FlhA [bacterium ADurb.Bin363]HPZ08249.1 FHIPEP family type III secretion protein [Candidatus Eremiobacteraeota bacterium]
MDKNLKAIKDSLPPLTMVEPKKDHLEIMEKEDSFYNPTLHDLEEEYKTYNQMIQKGEVSKIALFRLGRINHFWGKLEEAIKYYNKALELDPNNGEIYYNLGNIYFRKGNLQEAREMFLKAINANPRDVYALNGIGKTCLFLREFQEGERYHRIALEHNPEDVYALRGLGDISLVSDKAWFEIDDKTLEKLADKIELDKLKVIESLKGSKFSREELTNILTNMNFVKEEIDIVKNCVTKNYIEALSYYYKALDINPEEKITLYNIGLACILSGQVQRAREHYSECLKKHRFSPGFYVGLSYCYYKQDKKKEAFKNYKTALDLLKDRSDYMFTGSLYDEELLNLGIQEIEELRKNLREDFLKYEEEIPVSQAVKSELDKKPLETMGTAINPITVELGRDLLLLVDPNQGAKLMEKINSIRRHIIFELGFILPGVRFKDSHHIKANGYLIKIQDREVACGEIFLDKYMVVGSEDIINAMEGHKCFEPTYCMPALWIEQHQLTTAEIKKCIIFDPLTVMTTHITEVIKTYASDFIGRQEVACLLKLLEKTHPYLVKEIYPDLYTLGDLKKIFRNLLDENISIKDLPVILETLGDSASVTRDIDELTCKVRHALRGTITKSYQTSRGNIEVFAFSATIEDMFKTSIETDKKIILDRDMEKLLFDGIAKNIKSFSEEGKKPVLLSSPEIRIHVRRLLKDRFPGLSVICSLDIIKGVEINVLEKINIDCPDFHPPGNFIAGRNIFSYVERFYNSPEPELRCEALNLLVPMAKSHNLNRIFAYLDRALEDEEEIVKITSAGVIRTIVEDINLKF